MNLENYDGTAIDTSMFTEPIQTNPSVDVDSNIEVQQVAEPTQTETPAATVEPNNEGNAGTTQDPDHVNIPGLGDFTVAEIKEWKQGNLRQSDYTRKTQEIARQRDENKNAIELYDYLKQNPNLIQALKEADNGKSGNVIPNNAPTVENTLLKQVLFNQKAMEIDMKIDKLRQQYGDIDEIAIYKKAQELGTDDLEFVYKALNFNNNTDEQAIIERAKAELRAELEANRDATSTIVSTTPSKQNSFSHVLTPEEKSVASAMGMSESEYIKWMQA